MMKKVLIVLAVVFTFTLVFSACKSEDKKEVKKEHSITSHDKLAYQCPMKCEKEKTYEKEGKCPVCEMKLIKKVDEDNKENYDEDHD